MIKQYLDEGNSCDAPGNLVAYLHDKIPTYAFEFEGECHDIGTHVGIYQKLMKCIAIIFKKSG